MSRANHVIVTADRKQGVSLMIADAEEAEYGFFHPEDGFISIPRLPTSDARLLSCLIEKAATKGRTTRFTLAGQTTDITGVNDRVFIKQADRQRAMSREDAEDIAWRLRNAANAADLPK